MVGMPSHAADKRRRQHRLLYRLEAGLEASMFLLAIAWRWLFVDELVSGLTPWQQTAVTVIWIVFIAEYLLKLYLAPHRLAAAASASASRNSDGFLPRRTARM